MCHRLGWFGSMVLLLVGSVVGNATAQDHPLVRRGQDLYQRADLEGALQAFERAESADDLSRGDLVTLLERRVMVHLARLDRPAIDADLERLRSLEPDHQFSRDVPPEVVETFARLVRAQPGRLIVEAEPVVVDGEVEVRAQAKNDTASLVRSVRVAARMDGAPWQEARNEPVVVPLPDEGAIEYYAEAVGPGGAVVAQDGSRWQPHVLRQDGLADAGGDDGDGPSAWLYVGIGAGAAAAAAILASVLLTTRDDGGGSTRTQPSFPMVEWR